MITIAVWFGAIYVVPDDWTRAVYMTSLFHSYYYIHTLWQCVYVVITAYTHTAMVWKGAAIYKASCHLMTMKAGELVWLDILCTTVEDCKLCCIRRKENIVSEIKWTILLCSFNIFIGVIYNHWTVVFLWPLHILM